MNNFKQYLRVKPINQDQEIIQLQENKLIIKDPSQKIIQLNSHKASFKEQTFQFQKIFNQNTLQEEIFQQIGQQTIDSALKGNNQLIITYGQSGSGKSFTLFGEDKHYTPQNDQSILEKNKGDQRGIITRCCEYLFKKAEDMQKSKQVIISISLSEIYFDKIRDLIKPYLSSEEHNLILYENTNGQILVKDLTSLFLENLEQLYLILKNAFQIREVYENKGVFINSRSNTIFNLNIIIKDKENENVLISNSLVQFVELPGSERIAESMNEGQKYQESVLINQSLQAIGKVFFIQKLKIKKLIQCLQAIALKNPNINYKETKITRMLQNTMNQKSFIYLIGCINPHESNFEECLNTLQFLERTTFEASKNKNFQKEQKGNLQDIDQNNLTHEDIIQQLNKEILMQKVFVDEIQKEHKKKLHNIQSLLGIDADLDRLFMKSSSKDLQAIMQKKEALIKLDSVQKSNAELEKKQKNQKNIFNRQKRMKKKKKKLILAKLLSYENKSQLQKIGYYSSGVKQFPIPAQDKPQFPSRLKFKKLFFQKILFYFIYKNSLYKMIDQRHINNSQYINNNSQQINNQSQFINNNNYNIMDNIKNSQIQIKKIYNKEKIVNQQQLSFQYIFFKKKYIHIKQKQQR
ncbi:kinesin motor domain protein [Ichthyophthirius multifiliis]|uniref:Kinesin motor domain protein n=1 Tax=Ichthyophthirius multifiliis TaxID=5932 RepID=G0QN01_ICHMU|nr:kinesin motor domain protein [Ichthyophthirius multifiliis]EGR33399.1 kinesin motor domain protein [Ichthyophthirius multifiliis]|eukprot:XP_004037385.1 kinesin motor domain protein [Ichthyophthirius multifiliis]